ncbi:hypothetical protein Tco_0942323 [Tanacetum coccineum]
MEDFQQINEDGLDELVLDGGGYVDYGLGAMTWSNVFEVEPINYALLAILLQAHKSSDEENTPANDRFSKADRFHVVPPPITWNFLTLRADISFVDDEDDVSKVQTVSPVKTNETQTVKTRVDKIGQTSHKQGIGFKKIKACFVCKSTNHLIKDCNFHGKQSQEPKLKNVVNTGPRVVKPVWDNAKRVNHQKISKYPYFTKTFIPSGFLTRTGLITPIKQNEKRAVYKVSIARLVSNARPISTARPVSTIRPFALKIAQTSGAIRPIYPRMDNGNPEILLQDLAVVDSGCSSHMTGSKAYLSDYEDYNGGFVAFGSDPKGALSFLLKVKLYIKAPRKDEVTT